MKTDVVHPGTQHAFRLAIELNRRSILAGLYTGFAITSDGRLNLLYKNLPKIWQRRLSNRRLDGVGASQVHLHPLLEGGTVFCLGWVHDDQRLLNWRNRIFQELTRDDD